MKTFVWLLWQNDGLLGIWSEETYGNALREFDRVTREEKRLEPSAGPWNFFPREEGRLYGYRGRVARLELEKREVL